MHWQDFIFTAGTIIFIFALLPSIFSKDKPALSSSLITGTVILVFSFTYLTLSLWFSALTTFLTAICWYILAYQKYRLKK